MQFNLQQGSVLDTINQEDKVLFNPLLSGKYARNSSN